MRPQGIDDLTAAELSRLAYRPWTAFKNKAVVSPAGWTPDLSLSGHSSDHANQFIAFHNSATKQVVVAFKGTSTLSQLRSDLLDSGGTAWESLKGVFESQLAKIKETYPDHEILTDGHSLGGGMAQTAALEHNLSGYGQNALPISHEAMKKDLFLSGQKPSQKTVRAWMKSGNFFTEVNHAGDPATLYYAKLRHQLYLNTPATTMTLPDLSPAHTAKLASLLEWHPRREHSLTTLVAQLDQSGKGASLPARKTNLNAPFVRPSPAVLATSASPIEQVVKT